MHDFFQVLNDSGTLAVVGAFFTAVIIPALKQAHANAKNSKVASAYDVLDKIAEGAVALVSTEYEKTSQAKHDQAVATIESQLAKQGIKSLDAKDIDLAIEKAYQYFTATDTKSQAKQAEFDAGLAEADKVSASAVPATPTVTEPAVDDEKQAEIAKLEAARDKIDETLAKVKGSDGDA
jgi:hypothetical protein